MAGDFFKNFFLDNINLFRSLTFTSHPLPTSFQWQIRITCPLLTSCVALGTGEKLQSVGGRNHDSQHSQRSESFGLPFPGLEAAETESAVLWAAAPRLIHLLLCGTPADPSRKPDKL